MKLSLLKAIDGAKEFEPWFEKSFGHVVRARNEEKAIILASTECGDEGKDVWLNDKITSCEILTAKGEEEHILLEIRTA